jgi:transposase InsO family protein
VRCRFIEAHRETWPVRLKCRALDASTGGYYEWRRRPPCAREQRRQALAAEVQAIHRAGKARYGSPRAHATLVARGQACCVNTVAKLMRPHGIAARTRREFRCTTDANHGRPVAENLVDRQFEPAAANRAWTADIPYIPTRAGWLSLAAVEDRHSRRIVGWSMGERIDSRLVVDALKRAVAGRLPGAGLVAHSDRGSPYASAHYQRRLARLGIT